jgi:hypothetical protein
MDITLKKEHMLREQNIKEAQQGGKGRKLNVNR